MKPNKADCIYLTAKADDGKLHYVKGDMNSIMTGLCCGDTDQENYRRIVWDGLHPSWNK
ncbi:hypothetical protein [Eubacterium pyruvativorans]|uniref:hypothetical protein n=1 Tax=Eubacterium pyruvativorans TaxID=155865 RepID=UPI00389AAE62